MNSKSFVIALSCGILSIFAANAARAELVYSTDTTTDELVVIDTDTGSVTVVGELGFDGRDVDLATIGGRLFALNSVLDVRVDLYELDPSTGMMLSAVQVHTAGGNVLSAEGLSQVNGQLKIGFRSTGGARFASNGLGNLGFDGLVTNIQTGGAFLDFDGIGVDAGGQLYGCDTFITASETAFYTIDESTFSVNTFLRVSSVVVANDVIVDEGTLFALNHTAPTLYSIDLATNSITSIALDREGTYLGIALANSPPVAVASIVVDGEDVGDSVELPCEGGATVLLDGSTSFDPDGDDIEGEWAVADESGIVIEDPTAPLTAATFPLGVHEVTLTVYDLDENGARKGTLDVATLSVIVFDDTPPLVRISTDVAALWPANNKYVTVTICVETSDACSDPTALQLACFMTSSQPDDSDGTGEHVGDTNGQDGFLAEVPVTLTHLGDGKFAAMVQLRAERDGEVKAGRVYSINLGVLDPAGNVGQASTAVVVPHDGRGK